MKKIIAIMLSLVLFSMGCVDERAAPDSLVVAGESLQVSGLSEVCGQREAAGDSGIPLDCIVSSAGVQGPENKTYTIIGSDGYQKTVNWEDMQKGVLADGASVFPHLSKGFWVKDVVEVDIGG